MFDLFSVKPEFRFREHKEKASSNPGKIFTLLFIAGILFIAGWTGKEIFIRQNPTVDIAHVIDEDPPELLINTKTFPFAFGLESPTFESYMDPTIYTVSLSQNRLERIPDGNGGINLKFTSTPLEVETCTKEHFGEVGAKFENSPLNQLYCLKTNQSSGIQPKFRGVWESNIHDYFVLVISKCENGTTPGIVCKSQSQIDAQVSGGNIAMLYVDTVIDPKNYETPQNRFKNAFFSNVGKSFMKLGFMYLKTMTVSSDVGFVTAIYEDSNYNLLDKINLSMDTERNDGTIYYSEMKLSRNHEIVHRRYIKALDILSVVNGAFAGILFILTVCLRPYAKYKYLENLVYELFTVKYDAYKDRFFPERKKNDAKVSPEPEIISAVPFTDTTPKASEESKLTTGYSPMATRKSEGGILKSSYEGRKSAFKGTEGNFGKPRIVLNSSFNRDGGSGRQGIDEAKALKIETPDANTEVDLENVAKKPTGSGAGGQKKDLWAAWSNFMVPTASGMVAIESEKEAARQKQKEMKYLNMGFIEFYCGLILRCRTRSTKMKIQIVKDGKEEIHKILGILPLLKLAKEIEKLKALSLTSEQLELYEDLPPPVLPVDKIAEDNEINGPMTDHERVKILKDQYTKQMKEKGQKRGLALQNLER